MYRYMEVHVPEVDTDRPVSLVEGTDDISGSPHLELLPADEAVQRSQVDDGS